MPTNVFGIVKNTIVMIVFKELQMLFAVFVIHKNQDVMNVQKDGEYAQVLIVVIGFVIMKNANKNILEMLKIKNVNVLVIVSLKKDLIRVR